MSTEFKYENYEDDFEDQNNPSSYSNQQSTPQQNKPEP